MSKKDEQKVVSISLYQNQIEKIELDGKQNERNLSAQIRYIINQYYKIIENDNEVI